jgi:hypothetical protein
MQRLFVMVFSVTCVLAMLFAVTSVIASTPGFARGATHGMARGAGVGIGRRASLGIRRGAGVRQMTPRPNAIPTPLAEPAQAPIINGPLTPNGLPAMGNGLQ